VVIDMSKEIILEVSDEIYAFLQIKTDDGETMEDVAISYLEEGINLEKTLSTKF
jgi:hypothetical protein